MTTSWTIYESPLGPLTVIAGASGMSRIRFPGSDERLDEAGRRPAAFAVATEQLDEYFAGDRQAFELDLDLSAGTAFQRKVWVQLRVIPYGTTVSYGDLARAIGRPDRLRAVAATVGRTPVPIVIPCHRVIGADGSLTGYGGGLHRKQALLELEARGAAGQAPEPAWAFRQLTLS
ncbi:methylated-DNA--[protein]-cysteine S-methyltransferase [Candidatus Solirubrobacter pratensis]|uniref:methylated-DNA--[protein]-cysteine S-methyltransferase n=1 Tax=Candidatus Solirubrobacter pratensis TaxID=1298857 RepID=UPI00041ED926|nr:methylated-DNA--[protein]-cysteine S-methyltransferase [Candidatus Solirubrobacter pratensis]